MPLSTIFQLYLLSWRSALLVEVSGENHRPAAGHWQTLSHNVGSSTPHLNEVWTRNVSFLRHIKYPYMYIVIVCGLFEWKRIFACFLWCHCVYFCIAVGDLIIKTGMVGILLTSLTLPHFCACPKPGPGFPLAYVMEFFMFNSWDDRWLVILLMLVNVFFLFFRILFL